KISAASRRLPRLGEISGVWASRHVREKRARSSIEAVYGICAVFPGRDARSDVDAEQYQAREIYYGIYGIWRIRERAASDPAIFGLAGSGLLHPFRLQTRAMGNMPPHAEFPEVGRFRSSSRDYKHLNLRVKLAFVLPTVLADGLTKWGFRYYGLSSGVLSRRSCQRSGHIWACWIRSFTPIRTLSFMLLKGFKLFWLNLFGDPGTEHDSESPPRFTCSICDAMSGSDSPSSGKYRSSSELQSIGNTIMQASGSSFLTYFSFIEVPGATEMTRHTSVGRKSVSPSSSVSPILSSDIKSASLLGCLTNFSFPGFEELSWLRCCLEVDACILGNPFRLSTGSQSQARRYLQYSVEWADDNRISERRRHWISGSLFGRRISSTRGLRSKLTSSFGGVGERRDPLEDSPRRRHESSFGPISDDLDYWGRISGKPHRISRLNLFLFLSFLHLYKALASRFACLSTGTFRRWIPEPGVQFRPSVAAEFFSSLALFPLQFSELGRLERTEIQGWLLLAPGQARWMDGLKTVAEPEVQHFFFSSASWLASLQMRKSQHCYSRMQKSSYEDLEQQWLVALTDAHDERMFQYSGASWNDGSSCNNGREVEATKLDGSSGIPSLNDSVRQLDPCSLSQLDSHWGYYDSTEMTSRRWKEKPIPSGVARNLWAPKIRAPASVRFL
ncbi:hypothetical protein M5K25_001972, partial [Dendrobium thyrsiflorum]